MNETLFWSRTSELVMLVSMMSQSAMIQSSYNLPTPTIINRLGDICWCGDSRGEECKADKDYYHTSNFRECMGVNSSCMQLIKAVFFTASHARICISTTSHVKIRIRYCKSRVLHLKKNITRLLLLALLLMLRTHNNKTTITDNFQYRCSFF